MSVEPEYDKRSDTYTTGHEWDGIKELDTPLPRWWLWTFFACIIWAIGYWIVMPAWPLVHSYTKGVLGHSQRDAVTAELKKVKAARSIYAKKLLSTKLNAIESNPKLLEFAMADGEAAFRNNCTACHGSGAAGSKGYPNLNDDDWLWGGTLKDILETITVGVRSSSDDTRLSDMPAFLTDQILDRQQISAVAKYVRSLSNPAVRVPKGAAGIFQDNCAACHGETAHGNIEYGAPNLSDAIWLYGSDQKTVETTISYSRKGVMPTWGGRLDPATIRSLAVYVHSLGGGK
ncbi:MAG: cytochrome-c oxidase, cbb3-type subunit III [Alphaproteobacteria bacterium]|nr:cytochrome-c oxidase, cbb3-type subunit III [Alphaproteobacteria bacterium]